jgi:transposase
MALSLRETWAYVVDRQRQVLPKLDDMIAEDDPVRLFDEVLSSVDWRPWEAKYKPGKRGQPPIHPRFIAAAILYGLYRGIRSSRRLEEACNYRFDFMWLVHGKRFDYSTIANFRVRFREPLKDLFRQIGRLAMNLGLIRLCEVAFDGTRVKASNSRYNTRTAATLEEKLHVLDELYERLMSECQIADDEAAMAGSPSHLPKSLAATRKRRERIATALEQARVAEAARKKEGIHSEKNPAQVPMADPDSRVMPNKEGGYAPNYTPTVTSDGQNGFILDCDVLSQVNESDALPESVDRIRETFGEAPATVLTDSGNSTGQNMAAMEERGIELLTPAESHQPQPGNPAHRADSRQPVPEEQWADLPRNPQGQLDKSCFAYDRETDQYYCPQGRPLPYEQTKREWHNRVRRERRVYRCLDCSACPLAPACLSGKGKRGRTINRDQHEEVRERTAARMATPGARQRYNQRPRIAETPFALLKSVMGLRQFLLRGLEKVKTEWRWAATAFNLVKLVRGIARLRTQFTAMAQTP